MGRFWMDLGSGASEPLSSRLSGKRTQVSQQQQQHPFWKDDAAASTDPQPPAEEVTAAGDLGRKRKATHHEHEREHKQDQPLPQDCFDADPASQAASSSTLPLQSSPKRRRVAKEHTACPGPKPVEQQVPSLALTENTDKAVEIHRMRRPQQAFRELASPADFYAWATSMIETSSTQMRLTEELVRLQRLVQEGAPSPPSSSGATFIPSGPQAAALDFGRHQKAIGEIHQMIEERVGALRRALARYDQHTPAAFAPPSTGLEALQPSYSTHQLLLQQLVEDGLLEDDEDDEDWVEGDDNEEGEEDGEEEEDDEEETEEEFFAWSDLVGEMEEEGEEEELVEGELFVLQEGLDDDDDDDDEWEEESEDDDDEEESEEEEEEASEEEKEEMRKLQQEVMRLTRRMAQQESVLEHVSQKVGNLERSVYGK